LKLLVISTISLVVGLSTGLVAYPYVFSSQNPQSQNPPSHVSQVVVSVNYGGQWGGNYAHTQVSYGDWVNAYASLLMMTTEWSGNESKTVTLTRPILHTYDETMWVIIVTALKSNSTENQLTVSIAKPDGTTLASHTSGVLGYLFLGEYGQTFDFAGYMGVGEDDGFTFMKTEELKILSKSWGAGNANVTLTVRNTGTDSLTFGGAEINGAAAPTHNATGSLAVNAQAIVVITPAEAFTSGQKYEFAILTLGGNKYTYTATAP